MYENRVRSMNKDRKEFDYEFADASSMAFVHKKIVYDDSGFVTCIPKNYNDGEGTPKA